MDCSIVYYIAYKTGLVQRSLTKKFRTMTDITVKTGYAAVSVPDLHNKFHRALSESELVIVVGGLSAGGDDNVMTALSDYFTRMQLDVTFSKRVLNESGEDGYLIKSGSKYVLVLPDDPQAAQTMFGAQLLKNIDTSRSGEEISEPVRTHTVVFAQEQENSLSRITNTRRTNILLIVGIIITLAVCAAAAVWIFYTLGII